MGFSFIKNKSEDMSRKSISSFLKINKYEDPQMALDLVAHICTSAADLSAADTYESFRKTLDSLCLDDQFGRCYYKIHSIKKELIEGSLDDNDRFDLLIGKSLDEIVNLCGKVWKDAVAAQEESNAQSSIKIAVCGGYSSGKSSFLNSITGIGAVLPTGIEPVSMVNTYINTSDDIKDLCVRGKNIKGDWVLLDKEVLDCIQHSSKSKVHVASVLDDLYLYVPLSKEKAYLKNMTFIDTPGYNNSDNSNAENKISDKDMALKAVSNADVVFWCIDIEAGTISQKDIEILNNIEGNKQVLIIFNKMDKKSTDEVSKILKRAGTIGESKLNVKPLGIVAYSRETPNMFLTGMGNESLSSYLSMLNEYVGLSDDKDYFVKCIEKVFQEKNTECETLLKKCYEIRESLIRDKDKASRNKREALNDSKDDLDNLKDILLGDYDRQLDCIQHLCSFVNEALEGWSKSLDREEEWSDKVGFFKDASSIGNRYQKASELYNQFLELWNDEEIPDYWKNEYRKGLFENIKQKYEAANEDIAGDALIQDTKDVNKAIKFLNEYKKFLVKAQDKTISSFKQCYDAASKLIKKRLNCMRGIRNDQDTDIFSAIANDNMPRFLNCFSSGVDLTKCNSQGYSPLTYTAKSGNNAMMKFFISHKVDLSLKDSRGYNALETAASCHYQDICELLIEADRGLVAKSRPLVEVAKSNNFESWISKF